MVRYLKPLALALAGGLSFTNSGAEGPPVLHDPASHAGSGLNKGLVAGITAADFLRLGNRPKTATITLVTSFTGLNAGMNFNGYAHGGATYLIPQGWTVEVTFINPSPVPHSAVVVEREMLRRVQVGSPVFPGAAVASPTTGVSTGKTTFTFHASEPGEYAVACGIPNHAIGGHWIGLKVSAQAPRPILLLGEKSAPMEAAPAR